MRSFLRLGPSFFLFTTFIDPATAAAAQTESVLGCPALPRSVVAGVRFNIAGR